MESYRATPWLECTIPETTLTKGGLIVELDQISVDPDMRGRGIGGELIRKVAALARESAAVRLQLTVWEFNTRAQAVFAREGFSTVMRRMLAQPQPA